MSITAITPKPTLERVEADAQQASAAARQAMREFAAGRDVKAFATLDLAETEATQAWEGLRELAPSTDERVQRVRQRLGVVTDATAQMARLDAGFAFGRIARRSATAALTQAQQGHDLVAKSEFRYAFYAHVLSAFGATYHEYDYQVTENEQQQTRLTRAGYDIDGAFATWGRRDRATEGLLGQANRELGRPADFRPQVDYDEPALNKRLDREPALKRWNAPEGG